MPRKKLISIDFDGVLNSYVSGWTGPADTPDAPVPGAMQFLQSLVADDRFDAVIYSSRCASEAGVAAIRAWLDRHLVEALVEHAGRYVGNRIRVASSKPPAFVHIDDRTICFDGTWPGLDALAAFVPWNKKPNSPESGDDWRAGNGVLPSTPFSTPMPPVKPPKNSDTTPPIAWEPEFDAISSEQERLAIEFSNEIAGEYGRSGLRPDPLMILEMAEALYRAERDYVRATTPITTTMTLTTDPGGRPIVDGTPAITVDEMPTPIVHVGPIEDDGANPPRFYIPLAGGWEIQTKGSGSTFRLGNREATTDFGKQITMTTAGYDAENLEKMARRVHAATRAMQAEIERLRGLLHAVDVAA